MRGRLLPYLLDRDNGLLPHAPVFLLAFPGLSHLFTRRRDVFWLVLSLVGALVLPAAGHSLTAGGGTPLRTVAAIVPMLAAPVAAFLAARGTRRSVQVATGLLLLLSLQTALAYNRHHYKQVGHLVDWSTSGWKVNLMFPSVNRDQWWAAATTAGQVALWIAVVLVLAAAPVAARWWPRVHDGRRARTIGPRTLPGTAFLAAVAFVLAGTVSAATTGFFSRWHYRVPPDVAAMQAASFLDEIEHCAICVSPRAGLVGTGRLLAELDQVALSVATRRRPRDVKAPYGDWLDMPGRIRAWYVEAHGREPADTDIGHYLYQWREEHVPLEEIRRRIFEAAARERSPGPPR